MRARSMFQTVLLLGVILGLGLLVSCGRKSERVVAKIGNRTITVADYNNQYLAISARARPRNMDTMEAKKAFLEDIINKETMAGEAGKLGYEDDPDVIAAMEFMKGREIVTILRDEAVEGRIRVEPGAAREFYDRMSDQYHVKYLLFSEKEQADQALERARKGTPFSELVEGSLTAKMYPDADVDWRTWGDFDEPLNTAVFSLEAGEVTDVIAMPGGAYALAKVVEVRPNSELESFEDIKDTINQKIRDIQRRTAFSEWTQESIEKYQVEIDERMAEQVLSRLVWNLDPAGPDTLPEFSPEEKAWVLGTYLDEHVTTEDFLHRLMGVPPSSRPDSRMNPKEFAQLVRMVVLNEALLAEAYAQGIDKRPDVVKKLERAQEEQIVTLLYNNIVKQVVVTDEDVETHYEDFKETFRTPSQCRLSRIMAATEADARGALKEVRAGKPFEEVAKARSTDAQSAEIGGKMSPSTLDALPAEVRELVVTMEKGNLGGPIQTEEGWAVIRLDDLSLERQLALDECREMVRSHVTRARRAEVFDSWLTQKREELGIEIFEDVLAEIELVKPSMSPPEAGGEPTPEA